MTTKSLWPTLFVSHGAPTLVLEDHPARHFLARLGREIGRPEAIVCVSPHWETPEARLSSAERPETIHDFYGFPEPLYRLRYRAPGAPAVAAGAAGLIAEAGIPSGLDPSRGLDHGAWAPLLLMYPEADIPVTQLSIQHQKGPAGAYALGQALQPLRREGVLILASGGAVHNLRQFAIDSTRPADWAIAFDDWLASRIEAGDQADLLDYRRQPFAAAAHPRDEHLLPLFAALGAAGREAKGRTLHRSFDHGSLSMASYAFAEAA
jgi:4,5-DOPA dioxygenase extradiol